VRVVSTGCLIGPHSKCVVYRGRGLVGVGRIVRLGLRMGVGRLGHWAPRDTCRRCGTWAQRGALSAHRQNVEGIVTASDNKVAFYVQSGTWNRVHVRCRVRVPGSRAFSTDPTAGVHVHVRPP
jgi:hypothetical protein